MRYRRAPFGQPIARFGFVDHDDVGEFGQRCDVVGVRSGRGVDDDDRARLSTDPGGGRSGVERDLQLDQHDVAVGDGGPDRR
jgi:hypothetical protein